MTHRTKWLTWITGFLYSSWILHKVQLRVLVEWIMDAEVSARIGAGYGERSPARVTHRNGYRPRAWDTRVGTMDLRIPKLREGSYFRWLWSSRPTWRACPQGGWTTWSRLWDARASQRARCHASAPTSTRVVDSFLDMPLDGGPYRYLWLDALTQRVRETGRIVNVSVVVATAVNADGRRCGESLDAYATIMQTWY